MPTNDLNEFVTLKELVTQYPQFSKNQIQWLMLNRNENGLDTCVSKIGRKIYIHLPSFYLWFRNNIETT